MNHKKRLIAGFQIIAAICVFAATPTATAILGGDLMHASPSGAVSAGADGTYNEGKPLATQLSEAFEQASERLSDSIVPIFTEQEVPVQNPMGLPDDLLRQFFGDDMFRRFFGSPQQEESPKQIVRSLGSGVIISEDGYILTNSHVVKGAEKLTIVLHNGKKYSARIIGTDSDTDVAVVKIDEKNLPAAELGNSDEVKTGQWVIAIGNPFQLMHTVTAGIISAKGRSSVGLAEYEDFIQTDASINPGNSGGALADLDGKVIGINTAISSPSGGSVGIGFAIPINMARKVMDELISSGTVSRGYLGLYPQDIDENLQKALKLDSTDGALVAEVVQGGPADKAGIKTGDVITEFNGKKIKNSTELRNLIADEKPGSSAEVIILRGDQKKTLKVKLASRPGKDEESGSEQRQSGIEPKEEAARKLGLGVQNLTPQIARELGLDQGTTGVVVNSVLPGSPAEEAGMRRGDIIKEVNRKTVNTPEGLYQILGELKSGDSAALLVQRKLNTFFVAIQVP